MALNDGLSRSQSHVKSPGTDALGFWLLDENSTVV